MSSKQRIYEVAKQIQVDHKELVGLVQSWGLTDIKNYMSAIDGDVVDRIKRHYERLRQPVVVEERNVRANVVVRRRAPAQRADGTAVPPASPSSSTPVSVPSARSSGPAAVPAPPPSRSSTRVTEPKATEPKAEARVVVPPPAKSTRVKAPDAPRASTKVAPPPSDPPARAPEPEAKPEPKAPAAAAKVEAKPEPKAEAPKAEPRVEAKPEPKVEAPKAEPKVEAPKVEAKPETPKAEAKPEPKVEAPKAEPKAEAKPEPKVEAPKVEAKPEPKPEPKAEPAAKAPEPAAAKAPAASPAAAPKASPVAAPEPEEPAPPTSASPTPIASPPVAAPPRPAMPPPAPAVTTHNTTSSSRPIPVAASGAKTPTSTPPRHGSVPPSKTVSTSPGATTTTPSRPPKTGIEVWSGWQKDPPTSTSRPGAPHQRRVQVDINKGPTTQRPGGPQSQRPGQGPSSMMRPMQGRPGGFGNRGPMSRGPISKSGLAGKVSTVERKEKLIKIEGRINLQALAGKMSLKATEVLQKLLHLGMHGVHINSSLDIETAKILANEFGWDVEDVSISEEDQLKDARADVKAHEEGTESRPPIVTVMGHVDHGKTSLLDQIRKTKVADGEAGGITQHIGAYRVNTNRGVVTFLDTPGHEAFTAMRARGANLTDIVVLVVAADDGVMPQTREAVTHAKAAKVPIIVAVNKIDKPGADIDRIKRQLMEYELVSEEYGGDVIFCPVSAKTRQGVDDLLENIALIAENALELRSNPSKNAHAVVVESLLDKGKGPVARVIVRDGTLNVGDYVLSGSSIGKIRAMTNDLGQQIKSAGASTPVEILGLSDVPNAGDTLDAVSDPKKAQEIVDQRKTKERERQSAQSRNTIEEIRRRMAMGADQLELRVLVKADVQGSVEAIKAALIKLSGAKVSLAVVDASVGAITESDVNLAIVAKAIIVGFNVRPAGKAAQLAESEGIQIKQYSIIYQVIDDIRSAMEGLLAPIYIEKALGRAEVRVVFKLSKAGAVAGCMITNGSVKRGAFARVHREGAVLISSKVTGLKRFKEDVKEVAEGFECGISVEGYEEIKEGDQIEVFEQEKVRQTL